MKIRRHQDVGPHLSQFLTRACSHYPQPISDECEVDKSDKHDVELFESREDVPKALEPAE